MKLAFFNRKPIELDVFHGVDLNQLQAQYALQHYDFVDSTVGFNQCLYLLFSKENALTDANKKTEIHFTYDYVVFECEVDWDNQQIVACTNYHYHSLLMNYHFIRLVENDMMLVGRRCQYRNSSGAEHNVLFINRDTQQFQTYCFGDGIETVAVTKSGHIYTAYCDEGIFGSNGWEAPIGASGLAKWNKQGERLFENDCRKYLIDSCYAIAVDSQDDLWFYYYSDFNLVHLSQTNAQTFKQPLIGASSLGISNDLKIVLFGGGYHDSNVYQFKRGKHKLHQKRLVHFIFNHRMLQDITCKFVNSTIIIKQDNNLYLRQY